MRSIVVLWVVSGIPRRSQRVGQSVRIIGIAGSNPATYFFESKLKFLMQTLVYLLFGTGSSEAEHFLLSLVSFFVLWAV
jgi:hypothetical protein